MKTQLKNCIPLIALLLGIGFCYGVNSITASGAAPQLFESLIDYGMVLDSDWGTSTTSIVTPSTTLTDEQDFQTYFINPSSLSLSEATGTANTYASGNNGLLNCVLSSDIPNSITRASCRFRPAYYIFFITPDMGSDLNVQFAISPAIHIAYENAQAAMTAEYLWTIEFLGQFVNGGYPVIDTVQMSKTFDLAETSGVYDQTIPFSYNGPLLSSEIRCSMELIAAIQTPEPAALLLLTLGGLALRRKN
jgi:hypothetical protein